MEIEAFYNRFRDFENAVIDSRKVKRGSLFFAFSGDNFNAATQALAAIESGALAVIVEDSEYEDTDKNIFYVPSTLHFLQELARYHRKTLSIPFIGLTGSNGKTTTKELIHAVLSEKFRVQYTEGNLNNHIGVPLTVLSVKPYHEIAVIEMGANHQQEIAELCTIADPDIGYITNFGKAHLEGFGGFEGVIKGKSELYDYLKAKRAKILINEDDELQKRQAGNYYNKISFGKENINYNFKPVSSGNFVGISFNGNECISKLTGTYNFNNLAAAAVLGLHFGVDDASICRAITAYTPTNMRSQVVEKDGRTLVLDTYNANPSSMAEALKNFDSFKGSKIVILGDMLELGDESSAEHSSILELAKSLNFDRIITVGGHFKAENKSGEAFSDTLELIQFLQRSPLETDNLLLKGSRGVALEKILDHI